MNTLENEGIAPVDSFPATEILYHTPLQQQELKPS